MKTNELKCSDLKIGNLIDYFGDIIKVDIIDCFDGKERVGGKTKDGEHVYDKPTYFDPIELTEEMLVSLFGKPRTNGNRFDIYTIPTNGIEIQDRRKSALPTPTICILKFGVHIYNIKYLHQLQNTYYLLIGQELEVEL